MLLLDSQVQETRANSEKHVASFQGKKAVEDMLAKANAEAERGRCVIASRVSDRLACCRTSNLHP